MGEVEEKSDLTMWLIPLFKNTYSNKALPSAPSPASLAGQQVACLILTGVSLTKQEKNLPFCCEW